MQAEAPTYSRALTVSDRLRSLLNGKLRSRECYNIDNVSAIWHVTSCKGTHLPKCRGGVIYPNAKTHDKYKILVFVTDPQFNNWAEDAGLEIKAKWTNQHHIAISTGKVTKADNIVKLSYEELHDKLWILVDDLSSAATIADELGIGLGRARTFKNKMRLEQARARTKAAEAKNNKRISVGHK
jgi:hypothetical protein|tara:strand:+ start:673 stop:1221 length:549 start_codon:yes stop_codon:yes gene_type:complete